MDEARALRDLAELAAICEATPSGPIVPESHPLAELEEKILRESAHHAQPPAYTASGKWKSKSDSQEWLFPT